MYLITEILIGSIALIHCYILWLEMFAWTSRGKKVFKAFDPDLFERTKELAANQGLYNGFLAAGLLWTFFIKDMAFRMDVALFFLLCISIAGLYGAVTADRKIFFIQALPALVTIIMILML